MASSINDDVHAFNEQWKDIVNRYNPEIITISKRDPKDGSISCITFKMDLSKMRNASSRERPQFYVHEKETFSSIRSDDNSSEELFRTDTIRGKVKILPGFPATRPEVSFLDNKIPKHINIYRDGDMCIGKSEETVLYILFDNIFKACIYDPDPNVANYDSMADRSAKNWQKAKENSGEFPIIDPDLLLMQTEEELPLEEGLPPKIVPEKTTNVSDLPHYRLAY